MKLKVLQAHKLTVPSNQGEGTVVKLETTSEPAEVLYGYCIEPGIPLPKGVHEFTMIPISQPTSAGRFVSAYAGWDATRLPIPIVQQIWARTMESYTDDGLFTTGKFRTLLSPSRVDIPQTKQTQEILAAHPRFQNLVIYTDKELFTRWKKSADVPETSILPLVLAGLIPFLRKRRKAK